MGWVIPRTPIFRGKVDLLRGYDPYDPCTGAYREGRERTRWVRRGRGVGVYLYVCIFWVIWVIPTYLPPLCPIFRGKLGKVDMTQLKGHPWVIVGHPSGSGVHHCQTVHQLLTKVSFP